MRELQMTGVRISGFFSCQGKKYLIFKFALVTLNVAIVNLKICTCRDYSRAIWNLFCRLWVHIIGVNVSEDEKIIGGFW